jgi:hypothetical protein
VVEKLRRLREPEFRIRGLSLHARARASALANIELALAVIWKSKVRATNIPSATAIYEAGTSRPTVALFSEVFMAMALPPRAQLLDMMAWYSDILRASNVTIVRPASLVLSDPWPTFGDGVLLVYTLHYFCGDTGIKSVGLPPVNRAVLFNPPRDPEELNMNVGFLFGLLVEAAVPCPWSPKDFLLAQDSRMLIVQLWLLFERFEHMESPDILSPRGENFQARRVEPSDVNESALLLCDSGDDTGVMATSVLSDSQAQDSNSHMSNAGSLNPPAHVRRVLNRITGVQAKPTEKQRHMTGSQDAQQQATTTGMQRPSKAPPPPPPSRSPDTAVGATSLSPRVQPSEDRSGSQMQNGRRATSPDLNQHHRASPRRPPPAAPTTSKPSSPLQGVTPSSTRTRRVSLAHQPTQRLASDSDTSSSSASKLRHVSSLQQHHSGVRAGVRRSSETSPSRKQQARGQSSMVNGDEQRSGAEAVVLNPDTTSTSVSSCSLASHPERLESLTGALTSLADPHFLILRDRNSAWRFKFKVVVRPSALLDGGLVGAPDKITAKQCALQWTPLGPSKRQRHEINAVGTSDAAARMAEEYDAGGYVLLSDIESLAFPVEPTRLVMQVVLKALVPRAVQTSGGRSVLEVQGSSEAEVLLFFGHLAVAMQCLNGASPVIEHVVEGSSPNSGLLALTD